MLKCALLYIWNTRMNKDDLNIDKLAQLSSLALAPEQQQRLTEELNDIITMFNTLKTVDTTAVEPMSHPLDQTQPRRTDIASAQVNRERLQSSAPSIQDGLYIVPQFIEEK
jgi:aspartyl-tRNA(Asn)/glutamyl-tRNA(Gln) amidotransferase subunit C